MVDTKQFKQQNQEIQQYKVIEMPKIVCQIHQSSLVDAISLNIQSNNLLVCMKCVIINQLNPDKLVIIDELFSKNKGQIIKNWPPLQDKELYSKLNSQDVQENKASGLILKINSYFEKFQYDISKTICDHQKKIIAYINSMEENRLKVLETYNKISEKEVIKKQIWENQNSVSKLEEYLKNIIEAKQKQFQQDQQKLQDSFDNLTNCSKNLQLDQITNHYEQVLLKLQSLDFLNSPLQSNLSIQDIQDVQQNPVQIAELQKSSEIGLVNQIMIIKEQLYLRSFENLSQYNNYENIYFNLKYYIQIYQIFITIHYKLHQYLTFAIILLNIN